MTEEPEIAALSSWNLSNATLMKKIDSCEFKGQRHPPQEIRPYQRIISQQCPLIIAEVVAAEFQLRLRVSWMLNQFA